MASVPRPSQCSRLSLCDAAVFPANEMESVFLSLIWDSLWSIACGRHDGEPVREPNSQKVALLVSHRGSR